MCAQKEAQALAARRARARVTAARRLVLSAPQTSAFFGPSAGQWAAVVIGAAALAIWLLMARPTALDALHAFVIAALLTSASLRIAALVTRAPPAPKAPHDGPAPPYTVIAALYDEACMVATLVGHLARLNYPKDRLQVILALEEGDDATIAAAHDAAADWPFVQVLVTPAGGPRTKPRALNFALAHAVGDIVAVYDAEDRPHSAQLRAAVAALRQAPADVACVQAPLAWWNRTENWLTRQLCAEYAAQFRVMLPAFARWGWPLPLGGTSNHFRTAALKAVGGWDPHNVTEDADLGVRLAKRGYRSAMIGPPTQEEAVTTPHAWRRQRARWLKGYMQTWGVHTRQGLGFDAERRPLRAGLGLHLGVGLPILAALAHAPLALWAIGRAAHGLAGGHWPTAWLDIGVGALAYAAAALAVIVGQRRAIKRVDWLTVATLPVYWLWLSWGAAWAVADLVRRPHHWQKTRHGVSALAPPPAE